MPNRTHFRFRFVCSAGLILMSTLLLLIYSNTFDTPFVFDDVFHIVEDPAIRMADVSIDALKTAALEGKPRHRWLPNISWALNYRFHGYDVTGYHIVNLLLHLANGFLLFAFIQFTLSRFGMPDKIGKNYPPIAIAFAAALLWAVHPLHTQSVTFIYQRMTSMAALFFIVSLLLYAWGRNRWVNEGKLGPKAIFAMIGCILSGICALISKENAGMLPIIILLYEWFFFQGLSFAFFKKRIFWISGVMVIFGAIALFYLGGNPVEVILRSYTRRDFTLFERVMTEWRVVVYYVSLFLYPSPNRLNLDPDYPLSHLLIQPATTAASLIAITAGAGLAIYMTRQNRMAAFCILWFLINLIIESSVIGIEIIFEHRTYLPSMLITLPLIFLLINTFRFKRLTIAALCIVATTWSAWTYQRNIIWKDTMVFAKDRVIKSPHKARPNLDMGAACSTAGRLNEAIFYYQKALKLGENPATIFFNMGEAFDDNGEREKAIPLYSKALQHSPNHYGANNNIARLLIEQQRFKEAMVYTERILALKPTEQAHINAGTALAHLNRIDEAISHFKAALSLQPFSAQAHNNLGVLLIRKNDFRGARSHFLSAIRLRPDYASAKFNLTKLQALLKDSR